jgi:hypothetical protein
MEIFYTHRLKIIEDEKDENRKSRARIQPIAMDPKIYSCASTRGDDSRANPPSKATIK